MVEKKNKPNICPMCGDEDIDYLDADWQDGLFFYKCVCRQCGAEFTEVYRLEYDGYNMPDENDEEHIFDVDGNEL